MTKQRIHMIVHGRVQGIFFRHNTQKIARKLGLTGWVKNLPNRCVEIVAEGEELKLKELASWCNKGPMLARIEKIDTSWKKYIGEFKFFSFKY